jgi:hypothetical protein
MTAVLWLVSIARKGPEESVGKTGDLGLDIDGVIAPLP